MSAHCSPAAGQWLKLVACAAGSAVAWLLEAAPRLAPPLPEPCPITQLKQQSWTRQCMSPLLCPSCSQPVHWNTHMPHNATHPLTPPQTKKSIVEGGPRKGGAVVNIWSGRRTGDRGDKPRERQRSGFRCHPALDVGRTRGSQGHVNTFCLYFARWGRLG
jgi:hypothetical protein